VELSVGTETVSELLDLTAFRVQVVVDTKSMARNSISRKCMVMAEQKKYIIACVCNHQAYDSRHRFLLARPPNKELKKKHGGPMRHHAAPPVCSACDEEWDRRTHMRTKNSRFRRRNNSLKATQTNVGKRT
jgi:hypothetical protein